MTKSEFLSLYSEGCWASCEDGLYTVESGIEDLDNMLEGLPSDVEIEVVEDGLMGWPGDIFARITFADGQRAGNLMAR